MYKRIPLEDLIEMIDEGIVVLDKNNDIIFFNKKAKSLDGICPEDIRTKKFKQIFPELNDNNSLMLKVLNGAPAILDYYQNISNESGNKSSLLISCYPIYENGEVVASMEIYKDITTIELMSKKLLNLYVNNLKQYEKIPDILKKETVFTFESIIGNSPSIKKVKETILSIKNLNSSVLIYGETGVGKELFVQAIYNISNRNKYPFVSQNCAALPENLMESLLFGTVKGSYTGAEDKEGLFEMADKGILFLDEVNSMPVSLQVKLLRVLQDKRIRRIGDTKYRDVNVRVIASMNENPINSIINGNLREDIYYRLNSTEILIPPLRERKDDIELLVKYFINLFNISFNKNIEGISPGALKTLIDYDWPGNVRELKHVIEHIMNVIDDKEIKEKHLELNLFDIKSNMVAKDSNMIEKSNKNINEGSLNYKLQKYEVEIINKAILKCNGNKTKAAKLLKIPKQTLNHKLNKYNIK
ncbi:MAG: sigma 54-interacting transcriptional regulator [Tissierellia bacterium]|nr:sigma 54-interacting transcriptional regulator [Tissierellia bacterium]